MRTSEERARLIHRRTAEIKQEHRKKKQQGLYAVCMAACLFLVIGIGAMMPGLMKGAADGSIVHSSGTDRKPRRTWLYHDGAVGVSSWSLRDGSFIPCASEM